MIRFTGTTPPLAGRCQEIFFDPAAPSNTVTGVVESSVGDRTTKDNTNIVYNGRSVTTTGLQQMTGFVVGSGRSTGVNNQFGADCSPLFTNGHLAHSDMCLSFSIMLRNSTVNATSFSFGALTDAPSYTLRIVKGTTAAANRIEITTNDNYVNQSATRITVTDPILYYPLLSSIYNASSNINTLFNKWLNITVSVTRVVNNVATPTTSTLNYNVRLFINGVEHQPYTSIAFNTTTTNTFTKSIGFPWTNSNSSGIFFKLLSTTSSYSKINYRNNIVDGGGLGDVSLHDFRVYENNSTSFPSYNPNARSNYVLGLMNPILSPESTRNLVLRYMLETGPQNIPNSSVTGLIDTTKNVGLVGILPVFIKGSNNIYNYGLYPGPPISYYSGFKDSKPLIKSIFSFGTQLNTAIHNGATSSNIRLVTTEKTINSSSLGNDTILFDIQLDDGLDPQDYLVKDLFVVPTESSPLDLFLGRYPRVDLYGQRDSDSNWVKLLTYNQGDGGTFPNTPPQGQNPTTCNATYVNYTGTVGIRRGTPGSGVTREGLTFSILNTSAPSGITYDATSPILPANLATYIASGNYFKKYQFRIVRGIGSSLFTCSISGGIASSTPTSNGIIVDRINNNYYIEHIFCNVIKQNIPVVNNHSLGFNANFDTGQFRNTFNFREKFNAYTTKYFDLYAPTPFSLVNNVGHDTVSLGDNFYIPSYQRYTFDLPYGVIESTGTTINPGANAPTFSTTGYQVAIATQRLPTGETLGSSTVSGRELLNNQSSVVVLPFLNQNWKGQPSSINSIANTNNTITLRKRGKIRATASMVQSNQFSTSNGFKLSVYSSIDNSVINLTGYTAICNNNVSVPALDLSQGQLNFTGIPVIYNLILTKSGSPTYHFPVGEGYGSIFYCSDPSLNVYAQFDGQPDWTTQDVYHYNFYNGFTFYTRSGNTLRVPIGTSGTLINSTQVSTWTEGVTNLGANRTNSWNNCESKIKFTSPEILNVLSLTAAANGTPITTNIANSTPTSLVLTKTQIATLCNTTTSGFKRMMFCIKKGLYLSHLTFYRSDIAEEGNAAVTQLDNYFK
jgi:hypothetical protein